MAQSTETRSFDALWRAATHRTAGRVAAVGGGMLLAGLSSAALAHDVGAPHLHFSTPFQSAFALIGGALGATLLWLKLRCDADAAEQNRQRIAVRVDDEARLRGQRRDAQHQDRQW